MPLVTPFTRELKIDRVHLEKILERVVVQGCHAFVMGTTGEGLSLSTANRLDVIDSFVRWKRKNVLLYASVSAVCRDDMIDLAKKYGDSGVDVLVAHLPPQYPLSAAAMLKWFEDLADQSPCPVMLYNIPSTTGMRIPLEVVEQLSRHENIVGLKDSQRDENRFKEAVLRWKNRSDFSYFIGWAAKSYEALKLGADGVVPSSGNLFPVIYKKLLTAVKVQDYLKASQLQTISDELGSLYQKDRLLPDSLSALKVIMQELALCHAYVLPPLRRMNKEEETEIIQQFQRYYSNHKNELDV